jgi:hypothetical protein
VQGKVLLLSQRRIADLVAYCLAYEFEDTLAAVTDAQRIDATNLPALEFSRRAYKLARFVSGSPRLARRLAPYPRSKVVLEREFELFFPVFSHTYELYSLATIPNWRQRCRKAACFITEVWSDLLPEYLLELLSAFDHVFLGSSHCIQDVARITGRPCTYLSLGVDVLRFTPASLDQPRPIDVCNLGRRSPVTHQALLEEADRHDVGLPYQRLEVAGPADLLMLEQRADGCAIVALRQLVGDAFIKANIAAGATAKTDGWRGYDGAPGVQAGGGEVGKGRGGEPQPAGSAVVHLHRCSDEHLALAAAALPARRRIGPGAVRDRGLVDLDQAGKRRTVGRHHGARNLAASSQADL